MDDLNLTSQEAEMVRIMKVLSRVRRDIENLQSEWLDTKRISEKLDAVVESVGEAFSLLVNA